MHTQAHSPTPALQSCSSESLASPRGHLWCHGAPCNDAKPRPWPGSRPQHPMALASAHSPLASEAPSGPCSGTLQVSTPQLLETLGLDAALGPSWHKSRFPHRPVIQKCKKRPFTVLASRSCAEQTVCHQSTFFYSAVR